MYLSRTPGLVQRMFGDLVWRQPDAGNEVFLTFDDGPDPEVTPWVLDRLQEHEAKATFFCVGSNVEQQPAVMHRILQEGHSIGNHTFNHCNAWKVSTKEYLDSVVRCAEVLPSTLFRPPYGKFTPSLMRSLRSNYRIIMWDVLSGDFDEELDGDQCAKKVIKHVRPGSIVVLHDSRKAWPRLRIALPVVLQHLTDEGMKCSRLPA